MRSPAVFSSTYLWTTTIVSVEETDMGPYYDLLYTSNYDIFVGQGIYTGEGVTMRLRAGHRVM